MHLTEGLPGLRCKTRVATQSKKMSSWDGLSPGQFLARVAFSIAITAAVIVGTFIAIRYMVGFHR